MSRDISEDLSRVVQGSLSREELVAEHGTGSDSPLDLHDRLEKLSTVAVDTPPWYLVAPRLGGEPSGRRNRRRVAAVSIVAAFVLIPAAAEGIEAIAPEAVRDTVIDRITDVLPWDDDAPPRVTEEPRDAPAPAATSTTTISPTTIAPARVTATDATAVDRQRDGAVVDEQRVTDRVDEQPTVSTEVGRDSGAPARTTTTSRSADTQRDADRERVVDAESDRGD